jgi:hypothetical protein
MGRPSNKNLRSCRIPSTLPNLPSTRPNLPSTPPNLPSTHPNLPSTRFVHSRSRSITTEVNIRAAAHTVALLMQLVSCVLLVFLAPGWGWLPCGAAVGNNCPSPQSALQFARAQITTKVSVLP